MSRMEGTMQVALSEQEWHTLREMLRDYLPQLQREVARTEVAELRHELVKRQEVCEVVLDLLDRVEV